MSSFRRCLSCGVGFCVLLFAGCASKQPETALIAKSGAMPSSVATPASAPAPTTSSSAIKEKFAFPADAYFDPGLAVLRPEAKAKLDDLVAKVKGTNLEVITVVGHADAFEGDHAYTQLLSVRRAEAVKGYLVSQGVERNRVYTEGMGEKQPVSDNKTKEGHAKNRRVEIEVQGTRGSITRASTHLVPVLFATNRSKTNENDPNYYFSSRESEATFDKRLTFGRVIVSVPPNRQKGDLKQPGFIAVRLEMLTKTRLASWLGIPVVRAADPETEFVFASPIEELTDLALKNEIVGSLSKTKNKAVLLYVHGFANSFADAAVRTAQFTYDLADEKYDVVPMMFSWPSDPIGINYFGATDRAWSAGKQLAIVLDRLAEASGYGVIHIVAHSKGAWVLAVALDSMRASNLVAIDTGGAKVPKFNQIVLAAPDIRAHDFESVIAPAIASGHRVSNYVSSNDAALKSSKDVNSGARAGDSGEGLVLVNGVQTVDVSEVNYRPGGHSSFADSPRVLADIRQRLSGATAEERRLERVRRKDLEYWRIKE